MAISIDWGTKIISVPKADMALVDAGPPEIRELDLNTFRLTLKDLEDDEAGMPFLDTHIHNTTVTLGSLVLARVIEIINGYTVTFEDGNYQVDLVGANSNVSDVTNLNSVGLRSYNSAGLIQVGGADPGAVAAAVWNTILTGATYNIPTSAGRRLRQLGDVVGGSVNDSSPSTTEFDTDLTGYGDGHFDDQVMLFTSGNLSGQAKPILSYLNSNGHVTLDEPLTQAPADGDDFDMLPQHVHPISQIVDAINSEIVEGTITQKQAMRLTIAVLAGLSSGGDTSRIKFRDVGDSKDRVDETVDANGNRLSVSLDLT
jgi:hypothetical protein